MVVDSQSAQNLEVIVNKMELLAREEVPQEITEMVMDQLDLDQVTLTDVKMVKNKLFEENYAKFLVTEMYLT